MTFQIKHVYDPAVAADGTRVLVDRLWPRGLRKSDAKWALWMKDVALTPDLRRWFNHQPERFDEFSARYKMELRGNAALEQLLNIHRLTAVSMLSSELL
jgi:uncharacterized protein YeaO (DUF488 family)